MKKPILIFALLLFTSVLWAQPNGNLVFLSVQVTDVTDQAIPFAIDIMGAGGVTTLDEVTNPDGTYYEDFHTPDQDWWQIVVRMEQCNGTTQFATFPNLGEDPYEIEASFSFCSDTLVYGCTDPEAINYDPEATFDDGSCDYECTEFVLELDGPSNVAGLWSLYNDEFGAVDTGFYWGSDAEYPFCLVDGCYTLNFDLTAAGDSNTTVYATVWMGDEIFSSGQFSPWQTSLSFSVGEGCDSTGTVFGCTDPEAINYNPEATVDDGSCEYETDCEHIPATLVLLTGNWAYEMSWNIVLDGEEVYGGGNYESNEDYEIPLCLHDSACYVFEMFDSYGDGWNGGEFEIWVDGDMISTGGLETGDYGEVYFGVNGGCGEPTYGCTDPEAINYDPEATIDDGSCLYESAENDLCENAQPLSPGTILIDNTNATQNEDIWGECWNFGSGEGEQSSLWFSFTTPETPASIHIEAMGDGTYSLTDTQFGLFETCGGDMIHCDGNAGDGLFSAFDFACGELEEGETYYLIVDGWYGDAGTCYLSYEVNEECDSLIYGCTDPEAINYNPEATVDDGSCEYETDCEHIPATLVLLTGNWAYEMSWNIVLNGEEVYGGGNYESNEDYEIPLCLHDSACYVFEMFDSYGDGWNGGEFEIWVDGDMIATGGLETGEYGEVYFGVNGGCGEPIYGCTDPDAINYDPEATVDDGSCEYQSECTELVLVLDGPSNVAGLWSLYNDEFGAVDTGFYWGSDAEYPFCLVDGCYTLNFDLTAAGDSNTTVYATLWMGDEIFSSGQFSPWQTSLSFSVGEGCDSTGTVYGCTDPEAINYNPEATVDDGSCQYQFGCEISFTVIPDSTGENTIWIVPSPNIFNASEVLWDFGDGTTSSDLYPMHQYPDDGPYTLCLWAMFENPDGSTCSIEYCVELSSAMIGSGFMSNGFVINVIDPGITAVSDGGTDVGLAVYPNPASDEVTVEFSSVPSGPVQLSLFDINGKIVLSSVTPATTTGDNNVTLGLEGLKPGVYVLKLFTPEGVAHAKIVKR